MYTVAKSAKRSTPDLRQSNIPGPLLRLCKAGSEKNVLVPKTAATLLVRDNSGPAVSPVEELRTAGSYQSEAS